MKNITNSQILFHYYFMNRELVLVIFSLILGMFLLFQNPLFPMYFDKGNVGWYVEYSQNIFHPDHAARTLYWGESILLPLLGKILGASKSLAAFKVMCSTITLLILPTLSLLSLRYFQDFWQSVLMLGLFTGSFVWLREVGIGYPDPLTALLFLFAAFAQNPLALISAITLAALSHFSMATVGSTTLALLTWLSPLLTPKQRKQYVFFIFVGLIAGRLLLQLWYWRFDYLHVTGRISWFFDRGPQFFLNLYLQDIFGFWTKPGILFLAIYFVIVMYFMFTKRALFAIAGAITISIAYGVMFCTLDGLREFAITVFPGYLYLLRSWITDINNRYLRPKAIH